VGGLAGLEVRGWRLGGQRSLRFFDMVNLCFFVLGGDGFKSALSPLITTLDFT
jgi:hypothetical protein